MNPEFKGSYIEGLHYYQPRRRGEHQSIRDIQTDPIDWSERLTELVYIKHAKLGIFELASYDIAPALFDELARIKASNPRLSTDIAFTEAKLKENLTTNGIGTTDPHIILTQASSINRKIAIATGYKNFIKESGNHKPAWAFWPGEGASNMATLEDIRDYYGAVICTPRQIGESDDQPPIPAKVRLADGRWIVAIPFHRNLSGLISFDSKIDAIPARNQIVEESRKLSKKNAGIPIFTHKDGETYGGYRPEGWEDPKLDAGEKYVEWLLKHGLPENRDYPIQVVSINSLPDMLDLNTLQERAFIPGSWSCDCIDSDTGQADFRRWNGSGPCGQAGGEWEWKYGFYRAHEQLNEDVSRVARKELRLEGKVHDSEFVELISDRFSEALKNPGTPDTHVDPEKSLVSAVCSALVATTSCATFYDSPAVSGNMNILFAAQAHVHLRDAGLTKYAESIWDNYTNTMREVNYQGQSGVMMIDNLLNQNPPPTAIAA